MGIAKEWQFSEVDSDLARTEELELIQSHMAQKPVLRGEVAARFVSRASLRRLETRKYKLRQVRK